jgi:hypothetical protein
MMNDARQLAMHEIRLRRICMVEVVEAAVVEAAAVEVDVEMEVVVLLMSVLLTWKESDGSKSGVKMIDGAWKMLCNKGCGWNSTHTTGFHNEQSRSALNFKLPPEHMWWRVSGKQYAAAGEAVILPSGADATQVVQDRQQMSALTGVVDQYMTGTDNAEMSSFLGDMRRALGN